MGKFIPILIILIIGYFLGVLYPQWAAKLGIM